jgi:hypothetical protein
MAGTVQRTPAPDVQEAAAAGGLLATLAEPGYLDSIFGSFLDTNYHQGRKFSLDDILALQDETHFKYFLNNVPYRAIVTVKDDYDATWICIHLSNNAFVYTKIEGDKICRYKFDSWVSVDRDGFQQLGRLRKATSAAFDKAKAFYSYEEHRVDIKLYPKDRSAAHLQVLWEDWYPECTDSVEAVTFCA